MQVNVSRWLCLLTFFWPCLSAASTFRISNADCSNEIDVVVSPPVSGMINVSASRLSFSESAQGALTVTNLGPRSLVNLSIAVEYQNSEHVHLLSMVYQGGMDAFSSSRPHILRSPIYVGWHKAVAPLNDIRMQGYSPFLPTTCPTIGEVVALEILSEDGSLFTWYKSGLLLEASIKDFPLQFDPPPSPTSQFSPMLFLASISREGHTSRVDNLQAAPENILSTWVEEKIRSMTFYPALRDGQSTDSQIPIVVLFPNIKLDKKLVLSWAAADNPKVINSLVTLRFSVGPPGTGWLLFYGDLDFPSTNVRSLRAVTSPPQD